MAEFRFAHPLALLLLLAPLVVMAVPALRHWLRRDGGLRYSDVRLFRGLPVGWRVRLRHLPDGLRLLAWGLLVIGLARPQSGQAREVIRGQGIDIVLALDISTSMAALDFEPQNRLEAARAVLSDFIQGREFDRMGLVVFARSAFHQSPLTLDYQVLLRLLERVQLASELTSVSGRRLDGTAIGLGIASSANMLRTSTAPSKVIILLTDGANNAGLDPIQAAEAAAALGIRVYTIGMGRPGLVNIPDRQGNIQTIESDLNEENLQEIAAIADGLYFRAENTLGLQQIYDQIDTLERSEAERRVFVRWQEQAGWLLWPALALLLLERFLRWTVFQSVP
ncbi:MAG: VWA domain-containing protein [Anaerolineae bacterium]